MMTMITLILAKSDYIYTANSVYINLDESDTNFADRVKVISYFKTILLLNEEILDFSIDGIYVDVEEYDGGYYLSFNNELLNISVIDRVIVDYEYR